MTKQEKFIRDLGKLLSFATLKGISYITYSLVRTPEQQNELFKKGLSNCDGYDKISNHQLGLAVDLCVFKDGKCIWDLIPEYLTLATFWRSLGNTWGGDFTGKMSNDIFHFEV